MASNSSTGPEKSGAARVALRIIVAACCLLLAATAAWHYQIDRAGRTLASSFSSSFHLRQRRPDVADQIAHAPDAGSAIQSAAEAALQDSTEKVPSELDAGTRAVWLGDAVRVDDEVKSAQDLILGALRDRPGSAWQRSVLGMLDYRWGRTHPQPARWIAVLDLAGQAAPWHQSIATFAGYSLAESWDSLSAEDRKNASRIYRAALRDPQFVSDDYLAVAQSIGDEAAARLLPDSAQALAAAIGAEASSHRPVAAAQMRKRWERAEWKERERDLAHIRDRARFNDVDALKQACLEWTGHHSAYEFDFAAGRKQVAQVLAAWVNEPGTWPTDPRVDLIQFFVGGRMSSVDPHILVAPTDSLTGVPPPLIARVALAASDLYTAESTAEASGASASFEWTQYHVDLAWHYLKRGDTQSANAAVGKIAPSARDECETALVRRAIAAARNRPSDVDSALFLQQYPADFWSDTGVPICVDPQAGYRSLAVEVSVRAEPALLSLGFDGGRSATVLLPTGNSRVRVPLDARRGRHFFSFKTLAGGLVTPRLASLE
ncbi:MAG: hypothetical protein ABI718_18055 [Acidobacteriota bacterium]